MTDDQKIQKAIKNYLLKNPDYLVQHPDLLPGIEMIQESGDLSDFTAYQLRSLQKENQALKDQMSVLVQNAQQSESMMNRLFDLLLQLSVVDGDEFLPKYIDFVTEHFKADYFKILLDETLPEFEFNAHLGIYTQTHKKQFPEFGSKTAPLSGRLQQDKLTSLFPQGEGIGSAVVLPVGDNAEFGVMAFASVDQEKFHPNSASDLLQKLTDILTTYIKQRFKSGTAA